MATQWRMCGLLFAFLASSKAVTNGETLCDHCGCKSEAASIKSITVDCSHAQFRDFPHFTEWPPRTSRLDFSHNTIKVLPPLNSLELTHLDLQFNKIENITTGIFTLVRNLLYLNLSHNAIQEIDEYVFRGLEHLLVFRLNNNAIRKVASNAFYALIDLEELHLGGNPLRHIDVRLFEKQHYLQILDLAHTYIYALDIGIFAQLGNLRYLVLSQNGFNEVPVNALRAAERLIEVDLSDNPIPELTEKSFENLATVEILKLNYMPKLQHVGPETFSRLKRLRVLQMYGNVRLTNIDGRAFAESNGLTLSHLREVDLSDNNLAEIDGGMVPCRSLELFNLQGNPWKCDCRMKWIVNCSLPSNVMANLRCASPYALKDMSVQLLTESDFRCSSYDDGGSRQHRAYRVALFVTAMFLAFFIGISSILLLKRSRIKCCRACSRTHNASVYYVRAKTYSEP